MRCKTSAKVTAFIYFNFAAASVTAGDGRVFVCVGRVVQLRHAGGQWLCRPQQIPCSFGVNSRAIAVVIGATELALDTPRTSGDEVQRPTAPHLVQSAL